MSHEVEVAVPMDTTFTVDAEHVIRTALDNGADLDDICHELSWEEKAVAVKYWGQSRYFIAELVNECCDDGLQTAMAVVFDHKNEDFIREVLNKTDTAVVPDFSIFRRGQVWLTDNPGLLAKITEVDLTDDSAQFALVLADEGTPVKTQTGLSVDEVNELPVSERWMAKHQVTSEFCKNHSDYDEDLDYYWGNVKTGLVLTGLLTDPECPVAGGSAPTAPTLHECLASVLDGLSELNPRELLQLIHHAGLGLADRADAKAKAEPVVPPAPFNPRGNVAVLRDWSQSPRDLTLGKAYSIGDDRRFKDDGGDSRDSLFGDWEQTFLAEEILERSKAGDFVRCVYAPELRHWVKAGDVCEVANIDGSLRIQEPKGRAFNRPRGLISRNSPDVRFVKEAA